jgi:hypothetical protein
LPRAPSQHTARLHERTELREPRIARQSLLITKIYLLHDHGYLQQSVHKIENRIVNPSPGASCVIFQQRGARKTSVKTSQSKPVSLPLLRIRCLNPIPETRPEIHQRIPNRRHLPVKHGDHTRQIVRSEYEVVVLVIVVNQRGPVRISGKILLQPVSQALDRGNLVGAGVVVALGPTFDLAPHVALW